MNFSRIANNNLAKQLKEAVSHVDCLDPEKNVCRCRNCRYLDGVKTSVGEQEVKEKEMWLGPVRVKLVKVPESKLVLVFRIIIITLAIVIGAGLSIFVPLDF